MTTASMMYVTDGNSAYYNIQEDVSPAWDGHLT